MKAMPVISRREREAAKARAREIIRDEIEIMTKEEEQRIIRETIKIVFLALNEQFHFGPKRLNRLMEVVDKLCDERQLDEVFWYHNDSALKRLGLNMPDENYDEMM